MSENPYESPSAENHSAKAGPRRFTIGGVVISLAIILLLIALLLPATRGAGEAARRNACINNIKQIALALHNYKSAHGALPPAYTVDAEGNRLHSWRTLILPYLEETQIFEMIDLSKPWDDPVNAKAREARVYVYECPSALYPENEKLTTYLAVVGPDCAFSGPVGRQWSEIKDATKSTIIVVDVDSDRAVHWMSPHDVSPNVILEYGPESPVHHSGLIVAAFLDGHIEGVPLDSDQDVRRAMLTISGGELQNQEW